MANDVENLSELGFEPVDDKELEELGFEPIDEGPERSAASVEEPEVTIPEALLEGSKEGLTFGLSDELAGLLGTLEPDTEVSTEEQLEQLSPEARKRVEKYDIPVEPIEGEKKSLSDLYKEYRDLARSKQEQAMEQRPYSFTGGALASGALVPGGAMRGTKTLGQAVKRGAAVGAGTGAVAGAGISEAELVQQDPEVEKLMQDIMMGTGFGTALGGAIPVAGEKVARPMAKAGYKGAKKIGRGIKKGLGLIGESTIGPTAKATKRGLRGELLVGEEARRGIEKELTQFGKELSPQLQQRLPSLASLKARLIERAERQGVKLDEEQVDKFLRKYMEEPEVISNLPRTRKELSDLMEMFRTAKEGPLTRKVRRETIPSKASKVKEIEELKIAEQEAIESGVDPEDIDTVFQDIDTPGKRAAVVRQKVYNKDGEFKGYKKLASRVVDEEDLGPQFREKTEVVREGGRDLTSPRELEQLRKDISTKSMLGDESFKTPQAQRMATKGTEEARDILRERIPQLKSIDERITAMNKAMESIGIASREKMTESNIMNKVLDLVQKQDKEGTGAIKARRTLQEFIDNLNVASPKLAERIEPRIKDLSEKHDIATGVGLRDIYIPRPLATIEAYTAKGGNVGGYALKQMTPEALIQGANKLRTLGTKAGNRLSNVLKKAADLEERDRQATLFGIMQNPAYRKMIKENFPGVLEEKEK